MNEPIQTICNLTGCSMDEAHLAYMETKNVVDAVDKLLAKVINVSDKYVKSVKKDKVMTEEQIEIARVRTLMKENDDRMYASKKDQSVHEELDEMPFHHEETVLQNNCSQECQIPAQ
jgi:5'(3')-deoxyribonucleotidase